MTISLAINDLLSHRISEDDGMYIPPRSRLSLVEIDSIDKDDHEFRAWTEVTFKFVSLRLEYRATPQLLLNRVPPEIPTKKQARGKEKEAVQIHTKTVLCSELRRDEYVGFIPPGRYRSIQLSFGDAGASFSKVETECKSSNRIVASRNFTASAAKRAIAMVSAPNPETLRKFKKTARSFVSLLNGLKDDLVGVKPPEEIPDGPYGLEEYDVWFAKNCSIGAKEEVFANYFISTFSQKPLISVVLGVCNADPLLLAGTVHSILDQLYDNFELIVCDAGSTSDRSLTYLNQLCQLDRRIKVISNRDQGDMANALNKGISASQGGYIVFVDQEDLLNRDALFWLVEKINESPASELIYSDEDIIDSEQKYTCPRFKPDWNLLLLTTCNYIGHLVMVSSALARSVMLRSEVGSSYYYDLLLRSALKIDESSIGHVPRILYHRRLSEDSRKLGYSGIEDNRPTSRKAREDFLSSWSPGAVLESDTLSPFGRVRFPVPEPVPEVAIVIPTRDAPEVLERCVNSLVDFTKYPNLKIHIIDNQSTEARTLALFKELEHLHKAEIHSYDKPFNYSGMHNWLIGQLDSELICLLNNDTEIIDEDWLSELVSLVSLPGFAAAGSLLLYPDRTIQHAGVTLGIGGIAAHIGVGDAPDDPGYCSRNLMPQELSAVTAACLLIKRELYELVGGMNEERRPVSFNDVDLCLRLRAANYKIAWTPHSRLIHHESKSRGIDHEDELKKLRAAGEASYCATIWRSEITNDPYYNPNFDLKSDPYQMLASLPRVELTLKPYNKT